MALTKQDRGKMDLGSEWMHDREMNAWQGAWTTSEGKMKSVEEKGLAGFQALSSFQVFQVIIIWKHGGRNLPPYSQCVNIPEGGQNTEVRTDG